MKWHYHIETLLNGRVYSKGQKALASMAEADALIKTIRRESPDRRQGWRYRAVPCMCDGNHSGGY
jgi:hypothetical protein